MVALAFTLLVNALLSLPGFKENAHVECGTRRFDTTVERTLPTGDCASRVALSNETFRQDLMITRQPQRLWWVMTKTCRMSMIRKLAFAQQKISRIVEYVGTPLRSILQRRRETIIFCLLDAPCLSSEYKSMSSGVVIVNVLQGHRHTNNL